MRAITLLLFVFTASLCCVTMSNAEKRVVCYFGSWAVYRQGNGKFNIEDIDPSLCTHLVYTFIGLNADATLHILDSWADLPSPEGLDGYGRVNKLREKNPNLKTIIGLGGWNEGSTTYSNVFKDAGLRSQFAKNAVQFVKQYNFNGLDLDWEYPNQRGGVPEDVDDFTEVAKELSAAFKPEGLILSCAVGAARSSASLSYNIKEMSKYFDIINLMTYDLHGPWEKTVGLNAPLYSRPDESVEVQTNLNVKACIEYWLSEGAPAEKLSLGIPTYGHTYYLVDASQHGVGAAASGAGISGPYTQQAGTYGWNEVCELTSDWDTYFDEVQRAPYKVKGTNWLSYDDPDSVTEKTELVIKYGLGGAMIWSIETDNFRGISGEKYGILKAINSVLNGYAPPSPPSTTTPDGKTTTTTSQKPTPTPTPISSTEGPIDNICSKAGFVRDSKDCSIFYYCEEYPANVFTPFKFECPEGQSFDLTLDTCNYSEQVDC